MNELTNVNETLQKEIKKVEKAAKGRRRVLFPVINGEKVEDQELTFEFYDKVNKMYNGEKAPLRKITDTYTLDDINVYDPIYKQQHITAIFKNMVYSQIYASLSAVYRKYQIIISNDENVKAQFKVIDDANEEFRLYKRGDSCNMLLNRVFMIPYGVRSLGNLDYRCYDDDTPSNYLRDIVDINSYFINDITLIETYTTSFTSYIYKEMKEKLIEEMFFDCDRKEKECFSKLFSDLNCYLEQIISEIYDLMYKIISEAYVLANKYRTANKYNIVEKIEGILNTPKKEGEVIEAKIEE